MNKNSILNWTLLLILSIIWGSSFILMKKGLIGFNYLEVSFFRLIIAFLILIPFVKNSLRNIKRKHIFPLLVVSILGTVFPAILFANAQVYIDSAVAGMLNALTPIFTVISGFYLFNQKINLKTKGIGTIIGFVGTYILLSPNGEDGFIKYKMMIILATICYAISINTIKNKLLSLKPLEITTISSLFAVLPAFFYFLQLGSENTIRKIQHNLDSFYYLIILGIVCTSIAIILFNFLIKRSSALFASSTTYLIPVFALIWGIFDQETIHKNEVLGIGIILMGVFIMNYEN